MSNKKKTPTTMPISKLRAMAVRKGEEAPPSIPSPYTLSPAQYKRVVALASEVQKAQKALNDFIEFVVEDAELPSWEPKYKITDDGKMIIPNLPNEIHLGPASVDQSQQANQTKR